MSVGDDVLAQIPDWRTEAESLMVDTGTITRGGAPVFDPNTGTYTPPAGSTVHEGPCRVRMPSASEADLIFGDTQITTTRFAISFPYDVPVVSLGDVITITASDDPHISTRSFRVVAVPSMTFLMYRELGCEVVE